MSQDGGTISGVQVCEELLELATANLYRNNLFRILAVPVKAGPAEVRQWQKKIEMQRKLGLSAESGAVGLFALSPSPSSEVSSKAIERMNDPVARFLDEFFWFSAPAGDAGLAALGRGNIAQARSLWKQLASGADAGVHALQNLAVMDHLLALESPNPDGHASAALAAWKDTLAVEVFWDRVRDRVGEMNDVRLTTGFVRRFRSTLPRMLLLTFARQAVAASEQGDTKRTEAMLAAIRQSGYDADIVDESVREALKPLRSRISAAVASAKIRWTKNPQHGDRFIRELHEVVQPLLAAHDRVVDSDLARQGVHDEVGEAINLAEVAFCKATNNWAEGEKLLEIAKSVAMGQRLQDRIAENMRIDQENSKSGNDWCAPGYWDLSREIVAELEKARVHAEAGSYDAALDILLAMDKQIGFPLKRATAHCMSIKAIRKFNEAIAEFNAEGGVLKRLIESVQNKNTSVLLSLFTPPQPHMSSWQLPRCPVCQSNSYTSWANFTFRNVPLWMCSSCSSEHNAYTENKKRTFIGNISEPMQYLALAAKLDPQDPGIRRNKEGIEKAARESGHFGGADADVLAKKLTKQRVRRTAVVLDGAATDTCFFCGQRPGESSAAIAVPMHGPVKRTEFLLGGGVTYEYGDVVVPRCTECWVHHAEWPERIEAWHDAALRAADRGNFPEANTAEASARETAEAMAKGVTLAGQSVERARAAMTRAVEGQGFFARLFGRPNPARDAANAALAAAQRQESMAAGRSQQAADEHKLAHSELLALRNRAVTAYKAENPEPALPSGVRPEGDLMQTPAIATRQSNSWTFGDKAEEDSAEFRPKGTVSRPPTKRGLDDEKKPEKPKTSKSQASETKRPLRLSPSPPAQASVSANAGRKQQGDWSTIKLCQFCGKGTPGNALVCVNCGSKC